MCVCFPVLFYFCFFFYFVTLWFFLFLCTHWFLSMLGLTACDLHNLWNNPQNYRLEFGLFWAVLRHTIQINIDYTRVENVGPRRTKSPVTFKSHWMTPKSMASSLYDLRICSIFGASVLKIEGMWCLTLIRIRVKSYTSV